MGPRSNPFWELWSLSFWWAAWSLADTYLLPLTPISEVAVIWICVLVAGIVRLVDCIDRWPRRYSERIPADPPVTASERSADEPKLTGSDAV